MSYYADNKFRRYIQSVVAHTRLQHKDVLKLNREFRKAFAKRHGLEELNEHDSRVTDALTALAINDVVYANFIDGAILRTKHGY